MDNIFCAFLLLAKTLRLAKIIEGRDKDFLVKMGGSPYRGGGGGVYGRGKGSTALY